ncbi:MAG: hypothetical protein AB7S44_01290 [Spirochaetales bacterium]
MAKKQEKLNKPKTKSTPIKNTKELEWFRLDNAALIYPAVSTNKWNSVYRVSVILNDEVNKDVLQQALNDIMPRFPHFNVTLKKGIFWFYFQEISTNPVVTIDENYPCRKMDLKNNKHLFRVLYYNKKISFEAFHSLTDGFGAMAFINTLLGRYFTLLGHKIERSDYLINCLDKPSPEETEDSFKRYADLKTRNPWKENTAYRIIGTDDELGKLNIISGIMDARQVKEVAHTFDATITEFLLAIFFKSIINYQTVRGSYSNKPIKISMPIDLRNVFKTETLRNFSSYVNLELYNDSFGLDLQEIINKIKERTRKIDKNYVMGNINANVKAQKNFFLRITPLIIKNLLLKIVYSIVGEKLVTTTMSNIGNLKTPPEFKELIDRYEINLGAGKLNVLGSTVITFNNKLVYTFASTIKETAIQKYFFKTLSDYGINIRVESNL